jgi:two-component system, OmpR family, copper resistance phosphate regulon response regulator CusR
MNLRILLVEDEPGLVLTVSDLLTAEGYEVETAADGETGLAKAAAGKFHLVILDVMLPRKSGFDICRELRQRGVDVAIIMLTAKTQVVDRVVGLKLGADDYLTKPFDLKELLARLRALLRRSTELRPPQARVADLVLDTGSHAVERGGKSVSLTAKEYALLEYLVLNEGRVVGREQIAQHVWDEMFDPLSNTIDVYIKRLRAKLDAGYERRLIHTRRGEGYVLSAEAGVGDD